MKRRIAQALRSIATRLDPPPPNIVINISAPPRIAMPVFSPEAAARIGKQMAQMMRTKGIQP